MPAQVNLTMESDQDFYQIFQYTLPDGVTPISIVGATFTFGVRRNLSDGTALFYVTSTLSNKGQIQIYDGPNGKFSLWIAKAALQTAPTGTFFHAMTITNILVGSG